MSLYGWYQWEKITNGETLSISRTNNKEKITGATLHFVDESVDKGPIIMQKAVNIDENETVDSLKEKVQKAEQEIIVKAVDLFSKGKIKIKAHKVAIE